MSDSEVKERVKKLPQLILILLSPGYFFQSIWWLDGMSGLEFFVSILVSVAGVYVGWKGISRAGVKVGVASPSVSALLSSSCIAGLLVMEVASRFGGVDFPYIGSLEYNGIVIFCFLWSLIDGWVND